MSDEAQLGRPIPAPKVTPENQPFFDAAAEGRFLIKRCNGCGKAHWYPRAICPLCHSEDTVWEESSGEAEIYSYSVMRKTPTGPYALAWVTLDEGPSMLTNIVGAGPDDLKIGQRVKVRFQDTDGGAPVPVFAPV